MNVSENLYPKSPDDLPSGLTKLPSSYMFKVLLAILAIVLFFVLYLLLVIGFGYLLYYAIMYNMGSVNKLTILLKIGAITGAAMLFVFSLKFMFKLKNHRPNNRIKLSKSKYINLLEFVNQICKETGAPKPKNIYVDPDVNAYVAYSNTWLSLFLPVKKELTIGMGLIDTLNITEFKAVITHEFGHFAQKSMRIGSYINSANTIIFDMIYARDRWDEVLDSWRASDIRLSAAAWFITPVVWLVRQVLALFYQFLNLMYSLLSREMEFNADKVAVSTSGSQAIVSALWKLDSGFENWNKTISNAHHAIKKNIFVKNLYYHNQLAHCRGKIVQEGKYNSLQLDKLGNKIYFSSSNNSKVSMYSSHPPNDLREKNAKQPFVNCIEDKRSPWILFEDKKSLQEEVTILVYNLYLEKKVGSFSSVEVFEKFIEDESRGKELMEEYQHTFLNRFLFIDIEAVKNITNEDVLDPEKRVLKLKEELTILMHPVMEIEELMQKAVDISQGTTKETEFKYKDKIFKKKRVKEGYDFLVSEREKLFNEEFKSWDTEFCLFHLNIAGEQNKKEELLEVYKQHIKIVEIYKSIINTRSQILIELDKIQQRSDVEQYEINTFGESVNTWYFQLNEEVDKIDEVEFKAMPNIDNVVEFKEAIVAGGVFEKEKGPLFENGGFDKILNNLENAVGQCQRLEQKSIGLILMFHSELY